jgi:SAM-dependent methyltransferase
MTDTTTKDPSSAAFFETKYRRKADPWNFATDPYELSRYDAIVSSISFHHYRHAFEPGCSIGVLTERLAEYCDAVTAVDFSEAAALQAKRRCAHLTNVDVRCASIAMGNVNDFDLLVLSEIGYYFSQEVWKEVSWPLINRMPANSIVLAAHWLGHSQDHCISGDEVHDVLLAHPDLHLAFSTRNKDMRLDRLVRL